MTFCFNGKTTRLPSGTCWLMRKLQDPCGTFMIGQTLQLAAVYTLTGFWSLTGNWWIYGLMSLSMWNVKKLMKRRVLHCQDPFIFVKSFKMGCFKVKEILLYFSIMLDGQVKELHWTVEKPSNIKETPKIHRNNVVFSSSCELERPLCPTLSGTWSGSVMYSLLCMVMLIYWLTAPS